MNSVPFPLFSRLQLPIEQHVPTQSRALRRVTEPQFELDLASPFVGGSNSLHGLQFSTLPVSVRTRPSAQDQYTKQQATPSDYASTIRLVRAIWCTQAVLAFTLAFMVFGLLYWSHRVVNNAYYYYDAAQPYMSEVSQRGMSMVRHVDHSSAALDQVMGGAQALTLTAIPSLMDSVNRTTAMVARLEQVARNPTIKVSMA